MAEAALSGAAVRGSEDRFFFWMAAACVACAFGLFSMTYWGPLAAGRYQALPVFHIHGLLFSGWTLFLLWQAKLVADRRVIDHRAFGLLGAGLVAAMLFVGLWAALTITRQHEAAGHGEGARAFAIVPISGIVLFVAMVGAALVLVKRSDWHKRLMLIATVSILQAAFGRIFFILTRPSPDMISPADVPPAPVALTIIPGLFANLLIVAGMIYDWRTRGRVHPAYWIGGAIVLAVQVLRVPLSETDAWRATMDWLLAVAQS